MMETTRSAECKFIRGFEVIVEVSSITEKCSSFNQVIWPRFYTSIPVHFWMKKRKASMKALNHIQLLKRELAGKDAG